MGFSKLTDPDEINSLIAWHNANASTVTIDLETTGLDPFKDFIVALVISGREQGEVFYVPGPNITYLRDLHVPLLLLHNFKFDFHMAYHNGVDLRNCGPVRDTMLLHHLVDENASHALDDIITSKYQDNYKAAFWSNYKNFTDAPENEQIEYACKDVDYTSLLYYEFMADLAEQDIPTALVEHVHALAASLYDSELQGFLIDLPYLTDLGTELKPKILEFRSKMRKEVDLQCNLVELDMWAEQMDKAWTPTGKKWRSLPRPEFNFDSSRQLCRLLYSKFHLPAKKSKTGGLTVDDAALEGLAHLHPVIPLIQEYRGYQKTFTAFIEGTLDRMRGGRIYPHFNINGTVTGRISSADPNLQQLPSAGEWAKVRGIYIPEPGQKFITGDYSQLEVLIAAHFSQDPNLLKIILEGASKHDITANSLRIPRPAAKTLNFAMQYQCTHYKVRDILGCSEAEAKHIWNKYWETYSGERRVIDECSSRVDRGQPIINPFGRKRRFPTHFEAKWQRNSAYRQAYASLIQGTGADLTHWAFYTTDARLREAGFGRCVLEVHDEIGAFISNSYCTEARDVLSSTMVESGVRVGLTLPLSVECSEPLDRWEK